MLRISRCSSRVGAGMIVGILFATIDFPEPGGPIISVVGPIPPLRLGVYHISCPLLLTKCPTHVGLALTLTFGFLAPNKSEETPCAAKRSYPSVTPVRMALNWTLH